MADPFPVRLSWLRQLLLAALVGAGIGGLCLISLPFAAAVVLGSIICLVSLRWPITLGYLLIAAVPFTSAMERGRVAPLLKPSEVLLIFAMAVAAVTALANKPVSPRQILRPPRQEDGGWVKYAVVAFPLLFCATMLVPAVSYLLRSAGALRAEQVLVLLAPLQYLLLFVVFSVLPRNTAERRRLVLWMLFCASLVAAIGLLQAAQIGPLNAWLNRVYPSLHAVQLAEAGRVTSVMGGWNLLGTFLMVNLLLAWSLMTAGQGGPAVAIAMAVCALGLIASGSFAGIAGVGMGGLLILALNRRQGRGLSSTAVALLAAILSALLVFPLIQPLLQQRLTYQFARGIVPQTLQFRFKVWAEVFWPVIQRNLLWGVDLAIPTTYTWRWAESEYLLALFRFGILGLAAELAWLGLTLAWLHRHIRRAAGFERAVAVATLSILAVLTVAGLTNSVLSFFGTAEYLWILLALALPSRDQLSPVLSTAELDPARSAGAGTP